MCDWPQKNILVQQLTPLVLRARYIFQPFSSRAVNFINKTTCCISHRIRRTAIMTSSIGATSKVFGIYEILESVLLYTRPSDFTSIALVNRTFYHLTATSHAINTHLMTTRYFLHKVLHVERQKHHARFELGFKEFDSHTLPSVSNHCSDNTHFGHMLIRKVTLLCGGQMEWVLLKRGWRVGKGGKTWRWQKILVKGDDVLSYISDDDRVKLKAGWNEAINQIRFYDRDDRTVWGWYDRVERGLLKVLALHMKSTNTRRCKTQRICTEAHQKAKVNASCHEYAGAFWEMLEANDCE